MHGCLSITEYFRPLMFEVTAIDRWKGARDFTSSEGSLGLVWWVLIFLALAFSAAVVIVAIWKYGQVRRRADEFCRACDDAGLRTEETKLLKHITRLSGVKESTTIFTSDGAFNSGVDHLMHGAKVAAMTEATCTNLNNMLGALREKLGFRQTFDDGSKVVSSSRQISQGSRISVMQPDGTSPVDAIIVSTGPSEFLVEADEPLTGRFGQVWVVRCPVGSTAWEFDATVIRSEEGRVALGHSQDIRTINIRRFSRVVTHKSAQVALFPFSEEMSDIRTPHFVPAAVVEISGSGLLMEMPVQSRVGGKIIVVLKLNERRQVQAVAKTRRVFTDEHGNAMAAVELIGLNSDELTELDNEAKIAANQLEVEAEAKAKAVETSETLA